MFFVSHEVPAIDICCSLYGIEIQRSDAKPDVAVINIVHTSVVRSV